MMNIKKKWIIFFTILIGVAFIVFFSFQYFTRNNSKKIAQAYLETRYDNVSEENIIESCEKQKEFLEPSLLNSQFKFNPSQDAIDMFLANHFTSSIEELSTKYMQKKGEIETIEADVVVIFTKDDDTEFKQKTHYILEFYIEQGVITYIKEKHSCLEVSNLSSDCVNSNHEHNENCDNEH